MKRNKKSNKLVTERKKKAFETVQQMMSYFFPETDARSSRPNGNKRGSEVAERVFTEVTHSDQR
jgi:hypothetical protein